MTERLSDAEFQNKAEAAIEELEQAFGDLADDRDIGLQVEGGVLAVTFEEGEPGKFIISPNSSAKQLWVSARVSSFKFDWSAAAGGFVLAGKGDSLKDVMTRLTREQLSDDSVSL